jgi:hypothetical protein
MEEAIWSREVSKILLVKRAHHTFVVRSSSAGVTLMLIGDPEEAAPWSRDIIELDDCRTFNTRSPKPTGACITDFGSPS